MPLLLCSGIINGMGKAGKALRQVLETHSISQSKLATALGFDRPIVHRWFHEQTDPTAETVVNIVGVLRGINPIAAENFIDLFLGSPDHAGAVSPRLATVQDLPASNQVNIAALARLFDDTTNSYKYLFFISLLDILRRRQFDVLSPISFKELVIEMLANAWYPHTYFKLAFGTQDKIADQLDALSLEITAPILKFTDTDKKELRKEIKGQSIDDTVKFIGKYVPFRLIRPFFTADLAGLTDSKVNQGIVDLAITNFKTTNPLYSFDTATASSCSAIVVHEDWAAYIETNYAIIRAWVSWEWLNYMQKRNPNVPSIVNKIFMPQERGSLDKQTKYWRLIIESTSMNCIYSQQILEAKRFSLDHYLPWSFVAHDQLWNLIPVPPEVNSSKSNKLPDHKYLQRFIQAQYQGLTLSRENLGEKEWKKYAEPFVADLKLSNEEILNPDRLKTAYESTIQPLILLAGQQGFTANWSYSQVANNA
jgi:transcriptional regulator with XRE-family HTH domain